jgi:hypothetical protein
MKVSGGEIRSALTNERCTRIAWDLSDSPLQQGWIGVKGRGTLHFLSEKLGLSVDVVNRSFTEAYIMSLEGKVGEQVRVAVECNTQAYIYSLRRDTHRRLSTITMHLYLKQSDQNHRISIKNHFTASDKI